MYEIFACQYIFNACRDHLPEVLYVKVDRSIERGLQQLCSIRFIRGEVDSPVVGVVSTIGGVFYCYPIRDGFSIYSSGGFH